MRLSRRRSTAAGEWGHLGRWSSPSASRTSTARSSSCGASGLTFCGDPQTVDVGTGEWRYAYFDDPDGLYVCLSESRY